MLPHIIEKHIGPLLAAIRDYAGNYPAVVFDCSHLARIDTEAALQLLACVRELAAAGNRPVAFRDLNHLVAALLRRLGAEESARLVPHRY